MYGLKWSLCLLFSTKTYNFQKILIQIYIIKLWLLFKTNFSQSHIQALREGICKALSVLWTFFFSILLSGVKEENEQIRRTVIDIHNSIKLLTWKDEVPPPYKVSTLCLTTWYMLNIFEGGELHAGQKVVRPS